MIGQTGTAIRPLRGGLAAVLLALASVAVGPAEARSLDDKERAALTTTVNDFNAAMKAEDYARVISTVPPRVIKSIADKVKAKPDDINKQMVELMKNMKNDVQITSFSMDLAKAEFKELKNGTPYALIPTATNMKMADGKGVSAKGHTLAMMDEGQWYLLRVADAGQLLILQEVYPDFAGVTFPTGTMEFEKQ